MADFLRGLFGSGARNMQSGGSFQAHADPKLDDPISRTLGRDTMRRPPVMDPAADRDERAKKIAVLGATLSDIGAGFQGGQGGSLERVQAGWRAQAEKEKAAAQMRQLQALATSLYGDDPEAQLLFTADPESFVKARAERFKPQTMSGGQSYFDPATGQRFTAPSVEKFDDRMGFYDPETGEARFSDPRGPTYQEGTGRMSAEESGRHNREQERLGQGQLGVSRGNLGMRGREFEERRRQGGFGAPGAGQWEEF